MKNITLSTSSELFERLAEKDRPRLLQHALKLTRNMEQASDLVQDTLIKAMRSFDQFDMSRNFLNWTMRIMTNTYVDSKRRASNKANVCSFADLVVGDLNETDVEIEDTSTDVLGDYLDRERIEELKALFEKLPKQYQEAIELADSDEFACSYAEIAEIQGTTVGTIRSRLHRGKEMLREAAAEI